MIRQLAFWSLYCFSVPTLALIPATKIDDQSLESQQAVGSTVNFTIVSNQTLSFAFINWYFDTTLVVQITSDDTAPLSTQILSTKYSSRIQASASRNDSSSETKKVVQSMLTFGPLESGDSGIGIHAEEDVSSSPPFFLNVLNCSNATTNVSSTASCDFGCTANVFCFDVSDSVPAICLRNATWSVELDCTQETTTVEPTTRIISTPTGQSTTVPPTNNTPYPETAVSTTSSASNLDTSSATAVNGTDGNGDPRSGLSGGEIAGIVIGVLVGVALIGILVYCIYSKKSENHSAEKYTAGSKD